MTATVRAAAAFAQKLTIRRFRLTPARRARGKQWVQDYQLEVRPDDTLLDCLLTIKREVDPTLAFRYSCGHGMCGSDAVAVNGTPTLLCKAKVRDWIQQLPGAAHDDEGFRRTGDVDDEAQPGTPKHPVDAPSGGTIELAPLPGFPCNATSSPTSTRCSNRSPGSNPI